MKNKLFFIISSTTKKITSLATYVPVTAKGNAVPVRPTGSTSETPFLTDGFIKGTVLGTGKDGTAFNLPFNFQNYGGSNASTLDSVGPTIFSLTLQRVGDIYGNNHAYLTINTSSPTATSGIISINDFVIIQSLGINKKFEFRANLGLTNVTAFLYNAGAGICTGNFTFNLSSSQNSTGNAATITGSFKTTVTRIYNFVKPADLPPSNKKD